MYELSTKEFLLMFYIKLKIKLTRVLELTKKSERSLDETIELYETKSKVVQAIELLMVESESDNLRQSLITLSNLIISNKEDDIEYALNFCITNRT